METLSRPATVPVLVHVPDKDPDDHGVTSQKEPGYQLVLKDTQDNECCNLYTIKYCDTPAVFTS